MITSELRTAFGGWNGTPSATITQDGAILPAGVVLWKGSFVMLVGNKLYPFEAAMNTAALPTKFTSIAGADANGGFVVYSKQQNVSIQLVGGVSKTLGVTISYAANTVTVVVQLGTDGGGAVTSTAQAVVDAILAHATASRLIRIGATGTGLGLPVVTAATAVVKVVLLGFSQKTLDNSSGVTDVVGRYQFSTGIGEVQNSATDPIDRTMVGGLVALADNGAVKATLGALTYDVRLIDVSDGLRYVNVQLL